VANQASTRAFSEPIAVDIESGVLKMRPALFSGVICVVLFLMFLWSFVDPQLCSQGCGSALWGIVFLVREMYGLLGVRVLLVVLSAIFFGFTAKAFWER
jgi:hypothetical protein